MLNEVSLSGTRWMAKDEFEKSFLEALSDDQYNELISALDRITFQHFSYKVKDFIFKYRVSSGLIQSKAEVFPILTDEKGRSYVEAFGEIIAKHFIFMFFPVFGLCIVMLCLFRLTVNYLVLYFFKRFHCY